MRPWRWARPATLLGAWWAATALRRVRRDLRHTAPDGVALPPPPAPAMAAGGAGVQLALRRSRASCLERALVAQAWHRAHGRSRDVVVGVTAPSQGFRAHAWLDDAGSSRAAGFTELARWPASRPVGGAPTTRRP